MSFFGFQQSFSLEKQKQQFLEGGLREEEDVAVYNSNEQEEYDGLGDTLQERGDELNDETFGGSGPIGKDFDFSSQTAGNLPSSHSAHLLSGSSGVHDELQASLSASSNLSQSSKAPDAVWDDQSPFSVLMRGSDSVDRLNLKDASIRTLNSDPAVSGFSPFGDEPGLRRGSQPQLPAASSVQYAASGAHTLQEIEAEMRARSWGMNPQTRAEHLKPPRMRSQSPSTLVHQQLQGRHSPAVMQQQLALQRLQLEQAQQQQLLEDHLLNEQLLLDQQREQQIREQILEKYRQEQQRLRQEELEKHLRNEQLMLQARMEKLAAGRQMTQMAHRRQVSGLTDSPQSRPSSGRIPDIPLQSDIRLQQLHRQTPTYLQESPEVVQALQMQQRYLAQMAQAEFAQTMSGISNENQELLRAEAMKKIMEHERLEEKRREKAAKIAHMSRYNDLMTQSDKDFITRIQVSQLFTSDPYTEDFYAQVYSSLIRSRMGLNQDERVLKLGSGEGVGLGVNPKVTGKRPNALQRMEAQVERIVQNARQREKEKGLHALHSLQGALGKTAGRSYKAAPRQLLQVDTDDSKGPASPSPSHAHGHISKNQKDDHHKGVAQEAAKLGREALGTASSQLNGFIPQAPLTRRESLILLEDLYDTLLQVEQLRRSQVSTEDEEMYQDWNATYTSLIRELYTQTKILYPLETSTPHPFVSLLGPAKGKRLIPRLIRHLSQDQQLSLLTLLIATFDQLDVVQDAPVLDTWQDSPQKAEVERQTQSFMANVLQSIMQLVVKFPLAIINGLAGVLLETCNIPMIAKTRPGLAVLTVLLSRVELINQSLLTESPEPVDRPSEQDVRTWQHLYDYLFNVITPHLLALFPSTRMAPRPENDPGDESIEALDTPVWQFLAALALHGVNEQHSILVKTLREKVLDNLHNATKNWSLNDEERTAKIANVDLFLHALGLDSSQVAL